MRPDETELRETVERMEARLRTHPLFADYERLRERFAGDLVDERDVLLSRAAVLMLLQERASRSSDS
ncbi:MAG TPA: hypothetical protein VGU26_09515 [Gaiellaceae bacterium]|jgi:hypothetical protein|nr:hypothetical protein [Gaiellaceae bacterium]